MTLDRLNVAGSWFFWQCVKPCTVTIISGYCHSYDNSQCGFWACVNLSWTFFSPNFYYLSHHRSVRQVVMMETIVFSRVRKRSK